MKSNKGLIKKIILRAICMDLLMFDTMSLAMDLDCVDREIGLDFKKLLKADDFNFKHDIVGIQNNLDRQNEKIANNFIPRCALNS